MAETLATGGGMSAPVLAGEMEVEAYRSLFTIPYYERHLAESVRPDGRPLTRARDTTIALGPVASADGSALVKIGETTMLAAIKLEVMTPFADSPDEGAIAVDFQMPPICSPLVRPGRPAEIAPVIAKQLTDVIMSSGMINLKELALVSGKAAWMAYLCIAASISPFALVMATPMILFVSRQTLALEKEWDEGKEERVLSGPQNNIITSGASSPALSPVLSNRGASYGHTGILSYSPDSIVARMADLQDVYCLNANGSLLDAALLAAVSAFSHMEIPLVSVNDDGRVIAVSGELKGKASVKLVNKEKTKLTIEIIPFSLTSILHNKYILADPTAEEESIFDTHVTVVLDSKGRLLSLNKAGGAVLAFASVIKDCIAVAKHRAVELSQVLRDSLSAMELDEV
ncbi:hypothetical protein AXF42_Ash008071 [Apostasia shenzhenica]|uniref:Ribosomal RNA-processing protein 43 n=1 Tax=Apostasia shenzhenica TaxID=1088818 RepID=A0A2I0A8I0_9ASPA|nr:hypothetical protein AXF42_Ash008071 [Apostasia shenzhenica]